VLSVESFRQSLTQSAQHFHYNKLIIGMSSTQTGIIVVGEHGPGLRRTWKTYDNRTRPVQGIDPVVRLAYFYRSQNIADAFGGLATPPRTFNGQDEKKKEYRLDLAQNCDRASRSKNSPIGMPHNPSNV